MPSFKPTKISLSQLYKLNPVIERLDKSQVNPEALFSPPNVTQTVVYFIRRFGCQLCRFQSSEMNEKLIPRLPENTSFVAIAPEHLGFEEFAELKYFDDMSRVYVNPD